MRAQIFVYASSLLLLTSIARASHPELLPNSEPIRRLSDLKSEIDLAIRNETSTRRDLDRELREMEMLEVNRLIPEARTPASAYVRGELRANLEKSALSHGVRIDQLKITEVSRAPRRPPAIALTTQKPTWFEDNAIAESIELRIEGHGQESEARDVLLEHRPAIVARKLTRLGADRWVADAVTYRFRPLELPIVKPQDPARIVPLSLLEKRPDLAQEVQEIRSRIPESEVAFAEKARFMYYGARMSFFLRKLPPRP